MSGKTLLRDHLAPSVAKALAKAVFQVPVITDPLVGFLKEHLESQEEASQAEHQISRLVDQCLEPLLPLFASAKDTNAEAVAIALNEMIEQHLDVKALLARDLNRVRIHQTVMDARPPEALAREAYSAADVELYSRALPLILDGLIGLAPKLEGFEGMSTAEVLGRLTKLGQEAEALRTGIERLHKRFDDVIRFRSEDEQNYTSDYCNHIDQHLNAVQLFGITTEAVASQQNLSTAFIPLSLAHDSREKDQTGSVYFSSLLERLSPETPRLLITGPAGSGKTTLLKWAAIQAAEMIKVGVEKTIQWDLEERLGSTINALTDVMRRTLETSRRPGLAEDPAIAFRYAADQMGEHGPDGEWREPRPKSIEDMWWMRVPFFIPLRYCEGGRLPDFDAYPKIGTDFPFKPPDGWVQAIIQAGRALVLIDGIDEIPESDRGQIKKALEGFCRLDKGNYVVFTTRPTAIDDRWFHGLSMLQAHVNPLMETERAALINRWHDAAAEQLALVKRPDDASALAPVMIEKLKAAPHIAQLGTNPLLCAAICALHYSRKGYLPNDQADLCQQLCELLIHRRDEERDLLKDGRERDYGKLNYKHKEALLRDLAQTNLRGGGATLDRKAAEDRIRSKLLVLRMADLDPTDICRGLVKRTGMLREAYGGSIDFAHNTLRDFLAGKAFAGDPDGHKELAANVDREAWYRPTVFAAGKGERIFAEALIGDLIASPQRSANILAMLAENAATELDPTLSEKIDILYDELLPPKTVEEGRQLAVLGDVIVDRLIHPDADEPIAHACAQALRLIGTERARDALRSYWDTSYEEVAEELARVFDPLAIPFWQTWIQKQPLPEAWARQVSDVSALAGLDNLQTLFLLGTGVSDLTPLAGLDNLQTLGLSGIGVSDLASLAGLDNLQTLGLDNTGVSDLTPLASLDNLQTLLLSRTRVSDLAPLADLDNLQDLWLDSTGVSDLAPLAGLDNLQALFLSDTGVSDLAPLAGLDNLQTLDLNGTRVEDVSVLDHIEGLTIFGR